tara:strand:+ start:298 stop:531 length:234 start_codon:yes stop_codon:yes gene_type:complete
MKTVMKTIVAFETSDGSIFSSEQAAEKHEMSLSKRSVIEAYLDSDLNAYTGHAQRGMARTVVINWELWKVTNEITPE